MLSIKNQTLLSILATILICLALVHGTSARSPLREDVTQQTLKQASVEWKHSSNPSGKNSVDSSRISNDNGIHDWYSLSETMNKELNALLKPIQN